MSLVCRFCFAKLGRNRPIALLSHANVVEMEIAVYVIGEVYDGHRANQDAAADAMPRLIALLSHEDDAVVSGAALAIIAKSCDVRSKKPRAVISGYLPGHPGALGCGFLRVSSYWTQLGFGSTVAEAFPPRRAVASV